MKVSTIWLTTNRSCNNKCRWCYAQDHDANSKCMDIVSARRVVDMAAEVGVKKIILIGGEPTLYPDLLELVRYIKSRHIDVWIATNGRILSDPAFAETLVDAGVSRFDLSLKATSEEAYWDSTGSGGFEELFIGYRNLAALGIFPNVSFVISRDDRAEIDELIRLIHVHGIRNFTFQFVKPVIRLKSEPILPIASMGALAEYIFEQMKTAKINYKIELSFPLCAIREKLLDEMIASGHVNTCCHVQRGTGLVFDTRFNILPCNHFVDLPFTDESFASCTAEQVEAFLASSPVQQFREVSRRYPSRACTVCSIWDLCGGGCFTRWFYLPPEENIPGFVDQGGFLAERVSPAPGGE